MNWAQWAVIFLMAVAFFRAVYHDFEGRPAREPLGFPGFVGSVIGIALTAWLYWIAGLFTPHQ